VLEISYYVICDDCRNYAGYYPSASILEAFNHARALGWDVKIIEANTRGGWEVFGKCNNCVERDNGRESESA